MNGRFKAPEEFMIPWGVLRADVLYAGGGSGFQPFPIDDPDFL
jgi:hypothetical protein